ncbi:MAG: ferritin-like domain-containing protein [Actinomycetota bacterium]|nr:ferritin-like domain-containing protein [Actinomycetota bacterium]
MRILRRGLTAAAVTALFAVPACSVDSMRSGTIRQTGPSTTSPMPAGGSGPTCVTMGDGGMACSVPGRPLRRRRRRGFLLPKDDGAGDEARMEYASVASFAELGLQLMALGAPTALVARCHRAGLDEIAHAVALDRLSGGDRARYGPIPHLLGRRIGGRMSTRRRRLARIAVESFRDGWLNEGASAADMEARAQTAKTPAERRAFERIAGDERRHAKLGRDVVLWCFDEDPRGVGRALAPFSRVKS